MRDVLKTDIPAIAKQSRYSTFRRQYVVVIGVDEYPVANITNASQKVSGTITPLVNAVSDARAVLQFLKKEYGYIPLVPPMLDSGASPAAFRDLWRVLQDETLVRENDQVVVYYAGHGILAGTRQDGFWIPYLDAEEDYTDYNNWISHEVVRRNLLDCPARQVLLVADSCFSGDLIDLRSAHTSPLDHRAMIQAALRQRVFAVITSGGLEQVLDGGGEGKSVFCNHFIDQLRRHDGILRRVDEGFHKELYKKVLEDSTAHESPQNVQFGYLTGAQLPYLFVKRKGMFSELLDSLNTLFQRTEAGGRLAKPVQAQKGWGKYAEEYGRVDRLVADGDYGQAKEVLEGILERDELCWQTRKFLEWVRDEEAVAISNSARARKKEHELLLTRIRESIQGKEYSLAEKLIARAEGLHLDDKRLTELKQQLRYHMHPEQNRNDLVEELARLFAEAGKLQRERKYFQQLLLYDEILERRPGNYRAQREKKAALRRYLLTKIKLFGGEKMADQHNLLVQKKHSIKELKQDRARYRKVGMQVEEQEVLHLQKRLKRFIRRKQRNRGRLAGYLEWFDSTRMSWFAMLFLPVLLRGFAERNEGDLYITEAARPFKRMRYSLLALLMCCLAAGATVQALDYGEHEPWVEQSVIDPSNMLHEELLKMDFIQIRGGRFLFGCSEGDLECEANEYGASGLPLEVELDSFYIGVTEVTNAQFCLFLNSDMGPARGRAELAVSHLITFVNDEYAVAEEYADHPVVNISPQLAVDFTVWLSMVTGKDYTLPNEAEWEHACRGNDGIFPWGDSPPTGKEANFADANSYFPWANDGVDDGYSGTSPVGRYTKQTGPLSDMAGNAAEITRGLYSASVLAPPGERDGVPGLKSYGTRSLAARGGSYRSGAWGLRCSARQRVPVQGHEGVGLRIMMRR